MPGTSELWVIDTSSIITVREIIPTSERQAVYARLTELVESGALVYPKQVVDEMSRRENPGSSTPDLPYEWVKRNQDRATRHGTRYDRVKELLAHAQIRDVVDHSKVDVEDADPYVLELALHLREQGDVVVLTEERRDRPDKLSMNTACGLLKLPPLPIASFLAQQGIWRRAG